MRMANLQDWLMDPAAADCYVRENPHPALMRLPQGLCYASCLDQQASLQLQAGQPAHHPGAACDAQQAHHQQEEARTDQANSELSQPALPHLQRAAIWVQQPWYVQCSAVQC